MSNRCLAPYEFRHSCLVSRDAIELKALVRMLCRVKGRRIVTADVTEYGASPAFWDTQFRVPAHAASASFNSCTMSLRSFPKTFEARAKPPSFVNGVRSKLSMSISRLVAIWSRIILSH